jgi:hypothetical protein
MPSRKARIWAFFTRGLLPIVIIVISKVAYGDCRVFSQAESGGLFPNWNALVEGIWDYCDTAAKVRLQNQIAPLNITIMSDLIIDLRRASSPPSS